jgi:DNA repair exonuclease SbcCD ATPase subunit
LPQWGQTHRFKKALPASSQKALESEGITDSIAQQICQQPLQYLESLDTKQREAAEAFLERQGNPEGDLNMLMQLLRDDNYQVIPRVKAICRELTGVTPDFEADIDVEAILTDLVTRLCTGANPQFQGILILFDELYNYLQLWANDPVRAGSTTLQNITNICEKFKGRVALISFTQRLPGRVIPSKNFEDYQRLVSLLELLPSTYEPAASLELVLNGLLSQQDKTAAWQEFFSKWRDTLNDVNTDIYQNRTASYYQNRNWLPEKFRDYITLGCFPLHPLTSYLLCNLDFTQGRTAIQFVQKDVKRFIQEQPVEKNSNINLIHPVALVNAFEDNFSTSDYSSYSAYKHAYDSIVASADPEELTVLKSLFLFYASASTSRLTKSDQERHEEILRLLSGMPRTTVRTVLDKLCKVREVIYHNPADNTYRFYTGGFGIQDLRKRIEEEVANKIPSIEWVREYCQSNLGQYCGGDTVFPTQFIEDNRLISSDWSFNCKVYTAANFRKTLTSNQTLKDELGIVAYVIGGTSEDLAALRSEITQLLASSSHDLTSIKRRMAVAIASQPASDISRLLLMLETAKRKSVQEFGAALTQLQQQLQQQIETKTKELFKSCIYHCHVSDKVPVKERSNPSRVVSEILKDLYPFVPPVEKIDKMALKSSIGGQIIGYASKRLLENNLRPQDFTNQSYTTTVDTVFVKSWRLLKKSPHKYSIQDPYQPNVKAAWDKISQMTALGERSEKTVKIAEIWRVLSQPPYGYNEYTFTILFTGWLAYNSSELLLKGSFGIPQKKLDQVAIRSEPIKNWASTNVFDKPKDFVQVWIEKQQPSVIRRKLSPCPEVPDSVNYEQAQQFIQEINSFLNGAPDPEKIDEITKIQQQLTSSIEQIDALLEPTSRAENITEQADIETLLQLYTELQQPLSAITEDNLSVSPTEQQQNRKIQALQAVIERIGQTVEAQSKGYQSLDTEADCGDYKADIQSLITQLSQVADLPPRFTTTLQEALTAADNRLAEIVEQKKVENCLSQIQKLYESLSDLATQQEYIRTQTEIEQLVESVPAARETDTFRSTIQSLGEKQDALIRQIADWENQYSPSLSQTQAVQLSQRIHQQLNRYTDEANQNRLQNLLNNLNDIILERRSEEQEEEQLQSILASAEGKLEDTKNLNNLSDAFQSYQALSQLVLPPTAKTTSLEETQKQLESIKAEGHTIITQKILQIVDDCHHQLNQPQDYERLKRSLQRSQELVASGDEFAAVRNRLEEAEQILEAQYKDLQKRLQDENTMQAIRQNTLAKAYTIHLCEEAIGEITSLCNELHYPEPFKSELDKLIQGFKDRAVTYRRNLQNLCNRLSTVETSKELSGLRDEYAKLELVFKDSTDYPDYQQLQEQIHLLESDLEQIHNLETLYQQSQSIAGCDRTLAVIANAQANLHNLDRFRAKLLQIENQLRQRKQGYIQQLNELQSKLSSVKTLKEAQTLQKELADQSTYYRESQEEEQYEAISSEISLLISLLKIAATKKVDSVQACQAELERLSQWRERENTEEITPNVQALLDSLIQEVEQTKQQIQKRHKRAATSWLESIEKQDAQLEQLTDSATKLDTASQLLNKLKKQRQQHEDVLETEQKQILEGILTRCEAIQNQDTESKILALFQDLPHPQQESLLKKLTEYVSERRSCDSV